MFTSDITIAIQEHAISSYPNEACGIVTADGYTPLANKAEDPKTGFDCNEAAQPFLVAGKVLALVHSHPDGPDGPTRHDMVNQISMAVPWGITETDGKMATIPFYWGDSLPDVPLLERPFRHGPSGTDGRGDCYALVRDWWKQERGVILREYPRDHEWWRNGRDLYRDGFRQEGFEPADMRDAKAGDCFLAQIGSPVVNHAGVYIGGGLILHHLQHRLSVQDTVRRWKQYITVWLRRG